MRTTWIALFLVLLFTIPVDANADSRRIRTSLPTGWCTFSEADPIGAVPYDFFPNHYRIHYHNTISYCLKMWSNGLSSAMYEGKYSNTIELAYRIYGADIDAWARDPNLASTNQRRIAYFVALAVLRTDGMAARVGNGSRRPRVMPVINHDSQAIRSDDPAANLRWAVRTLESLATVGWVDQTHLAEAREYDPQLLEPEPGIVSWSYKRSAPGTPMNAPEHRRYKDYIRALRNAQYTAVVDAAYAEFGYAVNSWAFNPGAANWSQQSIAYVVALAVLRSDGQLSRHGITDAAANVKWATRTLEALAMTGRVRELHLAEAWGRDPATHDAALRVLQKHHNKPGLKQPAQILLLERLHRLTRLI